MDFHGFSWIFMNFHGFSWFLYPTDLEPMVFRTHNCFTDMIPSIDMLGKQDPRIWGNRIQQFEDNECCVCLSNYKEILDEDLHIVIPSCGHPLCCKCADNIVYGEKKQYFTKQKNGNSISYILENRQVKIQHKIDKKLKIGVN